MVGGRDTVNPLAEGTKASLWYQVAVEPGATVELRLRLRPSGSKPTKPSAALGRDFDKVVAKRRAEADEFYAELTPAGASDDEALVMRQAFAGMLWSKQLFDYDVSRWLEGDPTQPAPPASRLTGRNSQWRHFEAFDIMSMPDKWEYPWFAAWDLGFHCVALAHLDPAFAKYQLLLICREWFQHPNGALPAYEWDFGDVNPPVQAWAALEVFAIDGARDLDFLSKIFDKLLVNFTWWVNRQDADGSNLFEGGFLGLDNIGPIDRSHLPVGGRLEQSDATGWMAFYALAMASIASILNRSGQRPATDLVLKFLEHFAAISQAMANLDVWDDTDGLYYDKLITPDGTAVPVKVRSMVGIIPLLAAVMLDEEIIARSETVGKQFARLLDARGLGDMAQLTERGLLRGEPGERRLLLGVVGVDRLLRLFEKLFDEDEFLSPYGLRALSAFHRDHPYVLDVEGITATIDYEPAESTTSMFGGNSNWRGPLWFPLNFLVVSALERYYRFFGDDLEIEYPTRSGTMLTLDKIADDLRERLVSLFLVGADGRRPSFGMVERLQHDPAWKDNIVFNEYFHGDNGAGLGATHQTGWTGLVADLIRGRPGDGVYTVGELPGVLRNRAGREVTCVRLARPGRSHADHPLTRAPIARPEAPDAYCVLQRMRCNVSVIATSTLAAHRGCRPCDAHVEPPPPGPQRVTTPRRGSGRPRRGSGATQDRWPASGGCRRPATRTGCPGSARPAGGPPRTAACGRRGRGRPASGTSRAGPLRRRRWRRSRAGIGRRSPASVLRRCSSLNSSHCSLRAARHEPGREHLAERRLVACPIRARRARAAARPAGARRRSGPGRPVRGRSRRRARAR